MKKVVCSRLKRSSLVWSLFLNIALVLITLASQSAQAQQFNVIHYFTGGQDGANPSAGVTVDAAGNLYGTTSLGGVTGGCAGHFGAFGCGAVYKLAHRGSGWLFSPIYAFTGSADGRIPNARVVIGPNGALYGTTSGGNPLEGPDFGNVFSLRPAASVCKTVFCPWTQEVIYRFNGGSDGANPQSEVAFDQAGNLYGTAQFRGYTGDPCDNYGCGVVFELTPSNGGWTQSVLHAFHSGDGTQPLAGVVLDKDGKLYGTAHAGDGFVHEGSVYELAPSSSGWAETTLYRFKIYGDVGTQPVGGLVLDQQGSLYGATYQEGVVFKLSPSNTVWSLAVLWNFLWGGNGFGPRASLAMDASGTLYGTTFNNGGYGFGNVFKLTPSNGGWIYTSLYDFTGGSDGAYPRSNVTFGANGNLYGTTSYGGTGPCKKPIDGYTGCGVVWEIKP